MLNKNNFYCLLLILAEFSSPLLSDVVESTPIKPASTRNPIHLEHELELIADELRRLGIGYAFHLQKSLFDRGLERQFERLNDYLNRTVESDAVELNLEAAKRLLAIEERNWFKNRRYIEALRNFSNLADIYKLELKCTFRSFTVLLKNDEGTGGSARINKYASNEPSRVERIVYEVAVRHARACQQVYADAYNSQVLAADRGMLARIETFTKLMVEHCIEARERAGAGPGPRMSHAEVLYRWFVLSATSPTDQVGAQVALKVFELFASDDDSPAAQNKSFNKRNSNSKAAEIKKRIEQQYKANLGLPCTYYVSRFGPNIFMPADLDARYHHSVMQGEESFYLGWTSYRMCTFLLDPASREQLLKSIQKLVATSNRRRR